MALSGAGGYRKLPNLNIACSGLAVNATKEEWLGLAAGHPEAQNALDQLYTLFQNAPVLGSLIDPRRVRQDLFTTDYQVVAELLEKALSNGHSDEVHEAGVVAYGLARAASLLAGKYHWVITNVPYLTRDRAGLAITRCQLSGWQERFGQRVLGTLLAVPGAGRDDEHRHA